MTIVRIIAAIIINCKSCDEAIRVAVNDNELYEYDEYKLQCICPHCEHGNIEIIPIEKFN